MLLKNMMVMNGLRKNTAHGDKMNTFMPYPTLVRSVQCLDMKRLCKQRVEALQIFRIVTGITPNSGWKHHPAVKMWMGYPGPIAHYMNLCIQEWIHRGYKNTMTLHPLDVYIMKYPWWLGNKAFHASHRSNLLRKNPVWYSQFGWTDPDNLPYIWPTKEEINVK